MCLLFIVEAENPSSWGKSIVCAKESLSLTWFFAWAELNFLDMNPLPRTHNTQHTSANSSWEWKIPKQCRLIILRLLGVGLKKLFSNKFITTISSHLYVSRWTKLSCRWFARERGKNFSYRWRLDKFSNFRGATSERAMLSHETERDRSLRSE